MRSNSFPLQEYEACCSSATNVILNGGRSVGTQQLEIADTPVRDDFRETWFFDMVVIP